MTTLLQAATTANAQPIAVSAIPRVTLAELTDWMEQQLSIASCEISALFAVPSASQPLRLYAVLSDKATRTMSLAAADLPDRYPAITRRVTQAHWFERELAEQWGVVPEGHPWLKPIRFHTSYRPGFDAWGRSGGDTILPCVQPNGVDYFKIQGTESHEVAVGPVHAGVIEPGHFRFQCHGEHVFTLEIELGYQHRGIERQLVGGPNKRTQHYMETLSGDTSVGHCTAYCQVLEGLAGTAVPPRGQAIRALALELERLANHTGDLGALAGDVGYLPTLSFCGRIRGDFLNATLLICGNRFGRSLVKPGGVAFDIDPTMAAELHSRITSAHRDVTGAADLLWKSASVLARFEETGRVRLETIQALGVIGMAGRASGRDRDARRDFPAGFYQRESWPVSTWHSGDAFARAYVRHLEIQNSCKFILDLVNRLPEGNVYEAVESLPADQLVVSLVEGWRGEICHVALTDNVGRFAHYKVVDPSFHNWIALAMSLRDQQISDFPLCNKSFNLSYCGHDL